MALNNFSAATDKLTDFEDIVNAAPTTGVSLYTLQIRRDQTMSLWMNVEREYETCSRALLVLDSDDSRSDLQVIRAKYKYSYSIYERCVALLSERIDNITDVNRQSVQSQSQATIINRGISLPPIEIELFSGDYKQWPTFRDLFTAVYIDNPQLTPVERLFHLRAKTRGEANAIVAKSPLTHDGFQSAWENLKERFENKRMLVNSQLKILLNLDSISNESGTAIKDLQATIQGCLVALTNCQIQIENWDCLLVYICSSKLPTLTLSLWEQSIKGKADIPTWLELNSFLIERFRTLEAIEDLTLAIQSTQNQSRLTRKDFASRKTSEAISVTAPAPRQTCKLCSEQSHALRLCPSFLQMPVADKEAVVEQLKLCLNCFASGHALRECTSPHNCYTCQGRHHTLLHRGASHPAHSTATPTQSTTRNIQSTLSNPQANIQSYFASQPQGILLGTALVSVCHLGATLTAHALLDPGSEGTFISESLFDKLKLPSQIVQAQVSGLNFSVAAQTQRLCHFMLAPLKNPRLQVEAAAYVLPALARSLPSASISEAVFQNLTDVQLADPNCLQSAEIDLLIGADILPSIMLSGTKHNVCGSLLGQETIFGWILTGPASSISSFSTRILSDSAHPSTDLRMQTNESSKIFSSKISKDSPQLKLVLNADDVTPKRTTSFQCRVCDGIHALRNCHTFLQLTAEKRLHVALTNEYCQNCLAHKHSGRSCRSGARCRFCGQAHHTLLHLSTHKSPLPPTRAITRTGSRAIENIAQEPVLQPGAGWRSLKRRRCIKRSNSNALNPDVSHSAASTRLGPRHTSIAAPIATLRCKGGSMFMPKRHEWVKPSSVLSFAQRA